LRSASFFEEQTMPPIRIERFEPDTASGDRWAAYHAFRRIVRAELSPDTPLLSDAECEHEMQREYPHSESRRWLAFAGAELVGSAGVWFRKAGSPHAEEHARFLGAGGSVLADRRRQGIGSALLAEVRAVMHALDKTVLSLSAHTEPGHAFLTQIGAVAKHVVIENRAELTKLDLDALRGWEQIADTLGLSWEDHHGRVPRERLLSLLPVSAALFADMPIGELEMAPIRPEISGYDHWYETMDRVGGAHHLILLLAPDGTVAGYTEAACDSRMPDFAYQQLTAVARPWRGRGVARALKARMLREIRRHHPDAKIMLTHNAASNAAMIAINARVGFTVHKRSVDYQITRAALDDWFAAGTRGSA
jgi:GNAT superfamily N-acetyltransferase